MNSIILNNTTNKTNNIPTIDGFVINCNNVQSKSKQINTSNIDNQEMTQISDELILRTAVGVDLNFNSNLIATLTNSINNNMNTNNENVGVALNLININSQSSSSSSSSSTVSTSSSTNIPSIMNSSSSDKKTHNCPFCSRSFTRPYRLNDHISFSHTDERKYMCSICSKNFSCKDKLKHHIDIKHDNKKPQQKIKTKSKNVEDLRCSFPGCTKAFANKYNVKRHMENVHFKGKRIKEDKSTDNSDNSSDDDETMDSSFENKTPKTIAQLFKPKIESKSIKIEPSSTSTPILASSISTNKSKLIKSNLDNDNTNNTSPTSNNQPPPLTLVNVNSIGGITLTALGSIHQQHQQQIQQQQQQQQQQHQFVQIANPSQLTLNIAPNGSLLALCNTNQLIEQHQQSQQPIIYQQPIQVLQQVLNFSQQQQQQQPISRSSITNDKNLKMTANNKTLKTNNSSDSLNAVTVAAAAELVNSLLANSDNTTAITNNNNNIIGQFDSLNIPNFSTNNGTSNLTNGNKSTDNQEILGVEQANQIDEEKDDAKIYTCARCPEIFSSSILLRKHVSDNHEKGFVLYNLWGTNN